MSIYIFWIWGRGWCVDITISPPIIPQPFNPLLASLLSFSHHLTGSINNPVSMQRPLLASFLHRTVLLLRARGEKKKRRGSWSKGKWADRQSLLTAPSARLFTGSVYQPRQAQQWSAVWILQPQARFIQHAITWDKMFFCVSLLCTHTQSHVREQGIYYLVNPWLAVL